MLWEGRYPEAVMMAKPSTVRVDGVRQWQAGAMVTRTAVTIPTRKVATRLMRLVTMEMKTEVRPSVLTNWPRKSGVALRLKRRLTN